MKQIYLEQEIKIDEHLTIRDNDYHYLKHVLRLKTGNSLNGIDKEGNKFLLTIIQEKKDQLILQAEKLKNKSKPPYEINLFQCLPKSKKMDIIIRQMTETGVSSITPIISQNSIPKLNDRDKLLKLERWQRISKEAIQQSGLSYIPKINTPILFDKIPSSLSGSNILFHPSLDQKTTLHQYLSSKPSIINILIGPEGGFSQSEINKIIKKDFTPICLGDTILKVETATIFAIAAIQVILNENYSWRLP